MVLLTLIGISGALGEPIELPAVTQDDLHPSAPVLDNPSFDLLVLEIQEARGGGRLPLKATVRILQVIRGRMRAGDTATATWRWDISWERKLYQRPEPGTRFLAAAISSKLRDGTSQMEIVETFSASSKNLQIAARHMARPPLSPWPVVVMPLIGWVLLLLAKQRASAWPKALLAVGALASALATLLLYYNYERHMPSYYTIRVDMLLVSPALLASLAIPCGVWWLVYRRKRGGGDGG